MSSSPSLPSSSQSSSQSSCPFKDIFGKPNEGIHRYRIFGFATVDLLATFIFAVILGFLIHRNFLLIFLILLLISIPVHKYFCVETTLTNMVYKP